VVVGRICPDKGIHLAIEAARAAGARLALAGECFPYPAHLAYLETEIAPRLGGTIEYVGALGGDEKVQLLASARALLVPSLVAETSSLVAMEALACGTPVIAFPSGALPEVVDDGVTGLIVSDVASMAAAICDIERIDPRACRAAAEARFSLAPTTARYLEVYTRLARHT
jgi:glycosyltransferase involved in cell wall biosynthesis